jgi:hypothetical protein
MALRERRIVTPSFETCLFIAWSINNLSNPLGPKVVLTVSATAITALEFDSRALNSILSAIGLHTPKLGFDIIRTC